MENSFALFSAKGVLLAAAFLAVTLCIGLIGRADACTRAMYVGDGDLVITGRNMDWSEDMRSEIWAFPRGMARDGAAGPNSVKWTSAYGSVIVSGYNVGSTDGINEKGLVANVLYLTESDYGVPGKKPVMSISLWAQYVLDKFASVAETVAALRSEPFAIIAPVLPNGRLASLHLSLSDASGDSAIFEYVGGKLVIHHSKDYRVMTNSPLFEQQLAINAYWKEIDPMTFLPGSISAADRFVRTSFLINAIPKKIEPSYIKAVPGENLENQALSGVLGVMRAVSVPLGVRHPTAPNMSSTIWRTVYDHRNRVLMFDSATSPNVFWVPLAEVDLSKGAPVRKIPMQGGKIFSGNCAGKFEVAEPFKFLPISTK